MKITIIVTDEDNGSVRVICTPPGEELMRIEKSGRAKAEAATSAAMYALSMLRRALEISRQLHNERSPIHLPPGFN